MTQYIDKDALVAEIESKKKYAQTLGDNAINGSMQQFYDGMKQGCVDILSSLDTLEVKEVQEEPVSDELEKAAVEAFKQIIDSDKNNFLEIFKAGAKWQKEQMMKDAVDGEVGYWNIRGLSVNMDLPSTVEEGDKVKVIIIKED